MLEVGYLANATEDRSHFGAWAIASSPLTLSFDLTNATLLDRVWPIISNRALLEVNAAWAGSPGRRLQMSPSYQVWTKPLGNDVHALFVLASGADPVTVVVQLWRFLEGVERGDDVTEVQDLYDTGRRLVAGLVVSNSLLTTDRIAPHDSRFYSVRVSRSVGRRSGRGKG